MPHPLGPRLALLVALAAVPSACAGDGPAPADFEELSHRADSLADAGHEAESGRLLLEAARARADDAAAFTAATRLAAAGALDEALEALLAAADFGYARPLMLTNPAFDPLEARPEWAEVQEAVDRSYLATGVNAELYDLYRRDQEDRTGSGYPLERIEERDLPRIERVRALLESGRLAHAHDYVHAAMVLHHSHDPDDNRRAAALADSARSLEPSHPLADWLSAAALDRYRLHAGMPQWFGTQFTTVDGISTLDPTTIDTTAVDDDERRARNAAPLAELRVLMERFDSLAAAGGRPDGASAGGSHPG